MTLPNPNPMSEFVDFLYILDGDMQPVKVKSLKEWTDWVSVNSRRVLRDYVDDQTQTEVSTVFLGISLDNPPILFETMIFNGVTEREFDFQRQYSTYEEAIAGHKAVVEAIKLGRSV